MISNVIRATLGLLLVVSLVASQFQESYVFSEYFEGFDYRLPTDKKSWTKSVIPGNDGSCHGAVIERPEELDFLKKVLRTRAPEPYTTFWLEAAWDRDSPNPTFSWWWTGKLVPDFIGAKNLPKPAGVYTPRLALALTYDKSKDTLTAVELHDYTDLQYRLCKFPSAGPRTPRTTTTTTTPAPTAPPTLSPSGCTADCPLAFEEFTQVAEGSVVYTVVRKPQLPYAQAVEACAKQCGVLASVNSPDEMDFMSQLTSSPANAFKDSDGVWVGGEIGSALFYKDGEFVMGPAPPGYVDLPAPFICQVAKTIPKPPGNPFGFYSSTSYTGSPYRVTEGWGLKSCNNVPEWFKNRAMSVDTKDQCVQLCPAIDCQGTCIEVTEGTKDLKRISMGGKLVSFKSC